MRPTNMARTAATLTTIPSFDCCAVRVLVPRCQATPARHKSPSGWREGCSRGHSDCRMRAFGPDGLGGEARWVKRVMWPPTDVEDVGGGLFSLKSGPRPFAASRFQTSGRARESRRIERHPGLPMLRAWAPTVDACPRQLRSAHQRARDVLRRSDSTPLVAAHITSDCC